MQYILKLGVIGIVLFITISSIAGMASIFKSIAIPIGLLMFFIECSKYGATAYGYTQWANLTLRFKIILVSFVTLLSLLTSVGIFGFLGDSFQKTHGAAQKSSIDLTSLTDEKGRLESRLVAIDAQVSELPKEFVTGRLKLMQAFSDERKQVSDRLDKITSKLSEVQVGRVDVDADLGPVAYISGFVGLPVADVVGWIIILLSGSLDGLALFLTILLNRQQSKAVVEYKKPAPEVVVKSPDVSAGEWNFR